MFFKNSNPVIRLFSYIMVLSTITLNLNNTAKATNPVYSTTSRYWMDESQNSDAVLFDREVWFPNPNDWSIGVYTYNNHQMFLHYYVQNDWPRGGHTAEEAKRYYDNKWSAYDSSSGTADPKYNCASYATGRTGYWVEDFDIILENDYEAPDESNIDIGVWSGHVCLIGNYTYDEELCELVITDVCWKDRGSAFFSYYTSYWDLKLSPHYTSEACLYKEK